MTAGHWSDTDSMPEESQCSVRVTGGVAPVQVFLDFDGTLTKQDIITTLFASSNCDPSGSILANLNAHWFNGTRPFRDLYSEMTAHLTLSWDEACAVLERKVTLDKGVEEFLTWCVQESAVNAAIVSGAMRPCIQHLLHKYLPHHVAANITIIASHVSISGTKDVDVPCVPLATEHDSPDAQLVHSAAGPRPVHHAAPVPTYSPPINLTLPSLPSLPSTLPPSPPALSHYQTSIPPPPLRNNSHRRTWRLHHLDDSEVGFDKRRVVDTVRCTSSVSPLVIFIGDGFNDISAARLADFVCARRGKTLHSWLERGREGCDGVARGSREVGHVGVEWRGVVAGAGVEVEAEADRMTSGKEGGLEDMDKDEDGKDEGDDRKDDNGRRREPMRWIAYDDFGDVHRAVREWVAWRGVRERV